jgi:hypothetical protein
MNTLDKQLEWILEWLYKNEPVVLSNLIDEYQEAHEKELCG